MVTSALSIPHTSPIKEFLCRDEAAEFLTSKGYTTSKGTLQKYATVGGGPEYQIFGKRALYRPEKLIEWAASKISAPRSSTSEGQ